MNTVHVAFLWHMHQPHYLDPIQGYYSMPWVRLHGVKAYYDMARLAEKYPEMQLTFNLVPSLIEQLEDYVQGAEDYELILSRRDPNALSQDEKETMLRRFFQANFETMIKPFPRYVELLAYRGMIGTRREIAEALQKFAAQDYLDLQVLFNLAWLGFSAVEDDPDIRRLVSRGRFFTVEDRDLVLDGHFEVLKKLIPLYGRLWKEDAVDLTASPYYHPIMPLLCDTSIAREGMPGCLLPKQAFVQPGDAERQVTDALDFFASRFGQKPAGMWPSEGSVSPQALEILHAAGVQWAATDEAILEKSLDSYSRGRDLYRPWNAHGVSMFFRDHTLSDQIGFVYSRNPAETAVEDFLGRLGKIAEAGDGSPRLVSVILDGENPWEYFPGSGKDFLSLLYERIIAEPSITPVSFTNYLAEHPPGGAIRSIFPGSWINGNFDTWMGDREEADGWDALRNTRELLIQHESELSAGDREEAWCEIYRAEGSDWFWWYGEDHTSPNDPEFDRLFRAHLERVYQILDIKPPAEVTEPIIKKQVVRADVEPTGLITPLIDGELTTFYEWRAAGWVPTSGPGGAMGGREPFLRDIHYGFDMEYFYLRIDFVEREEPVDFADWTIDVLIRNGEEHRLVIDLAEPDSFTLLRRKKDRWIRRARRPDSALGKVLEAGVRFRDLSAGTGDMVSFTVTALEGSVEQERWPLTGMISFRVPGREYESVMWEI